MTNKYNFNYEPTMPSGLTNSSSNPENLQNIITENEVPEIVHLDGESVITPTKDLAVMQLYNKITKKLVDIYVPGFAKVFVTDERIEKGNENQLKFLGWILDHSSLGMVSSLLTKEKLSKHIADGFQEIDGILAKPEVNNQIQNLAAEYFQDGQVSQENFENLKAQFLSEALSVIESEKGE